MAFIGITTGLRKNPLGQEGVTNHYRFSYDSPLQKTLANPTGIEPDRTNAVIDACEKDFDIMQGWFQGINLNPTVTTPIPILVNSEDGGANSGGTRPNVVVTLNPGSANSDFCRDLLVAEITELFMEAQGKGWFAPESGEQNTGEGLSHFLTQQFEIVTGIDTGNAFAGNGKLWLNVESFTVDGATYGLRADFVNKTLERDHANDPASGCAVLFIYYLFTQRAFSLNSIIAAAAPTLAGVYKNLTGRVDGWDAFSKLVNDHYPHVINGEVFTYNPLGDNIFPVSELSAFSGARIVSGYSGTMEIFIDRPAMAEVNIQLTSDDPKLVRVVSPIATIAPGNMSTSISIATTALSVPFTRKAVNVHAQYAGKTLTAAVEVVPPRVVSVTLSPDTVAGGDSTTVTVTLDQASLLGNVVVEVLGHPFFAPFPKELGGDEEGKGPLTIPQDSPSATVVITTPDLYCESGIAEITAVYLSGTDSESSASAQLKVKPRVLHGALASLTLFPSTVTGGLPSRGRITLTEAAPTDTLVGLAAVEPGTGLLPLPGQESSVASIDPPSFTIPAGSTTAMFTISTKKIPPGTGPRHTATILAGTCNTKFAILTVTS